VGPDTCLKGWCVTTLPPLYVTLTIPDHSFRKGVGCRVPRQRCTSTFSDHLGFPRETESRLYKTFMHRKFVWNWQVANGRSSGYRNHHCADVPACRRITRLHVSHLLSDMIYNMIHQNFLHLMKNFVVGSLQFQFREIVRNIQSPGSYMHSWPLF
jgi:hypothetical protein